MRMLSAQLANPVAGALVSFASLLLHAGDVQAHGTASEVRILGQNLDGYDVTVRTAPKQPRTGRLHIEVQLIAPDSLTYIEAATVTASAHLRAGTTHQAGPVRSHYRPPWHEMELTLNKSGTWDVRLAIEGPHGRRMTTFRVEILPD